MPFCANFQVLRKYRGAISHAGHAARFAPLNITVTAIAPRPFASDMNINARDHGDAVARQVPAGRIGCDDDMGAACRHVPATMSSARRSALTASPTAAPGIDGARWQGTQQLAASD
jgi:2-deoxy-D-gluconate 3-dehydrogenase